MTAADILSELPTRTHCCFCSMQCGVELSKNVETGKMTVTPSQDFPVATGRLCQKGFNVVEHAVHPDRIIYPLMRAMGSNKDPDHDSWIQTDWNSAYTNIADRIKQLQEAYGHDAIAVYGGGSLTNEVCYLLGKFTRVALRSKFIDYNGRYCMSSAAAASNKAFGVDRGMSMPLSEIPHAQYIILAGTNVAECQPTMMPYLMEAKKNKATIVTIDPRQTMTSKIADIHVRLQPGFDSVFVNGLLHVILYENLADDTFIQTMTTGIDELKKTVEPYTPEYVERLTGVMGAVTRTIARGFARVASGIVLTARGLEQQINGVENTLNYINLSLVTGKIAKKGCGYGAVTGQANGQGGREHGQKADQLPGYRLIEDENARIHVSKIWGISPDELPGKGVSAFEMFHKIEQGEIRGMIVLGSNPLVSSPNNKYVVRMLEKLDLLVVVDMFETETAKYADWILPGSSFLEAEGTITNLEGRVFHRSQAMDLPGESKLDFTIISELADYLGRGKYFQYETIEEVFDELARATEGGKADYSGITYEKLKREKGIFWPCPSNEHTGTPTMFVNGFHHSDGKARIHGIIPKMPAEPIDREYPYILTTGRLANHYLSGVQTRRTEGLNRKSPHPVVELHPTVAQKIGLKLGDHIRLTSRRGSLSFPFKISEGIHPTTIFVPFHWGGDMSINQLTIGALDPTSRMPEFKLCAVKAERVDDSILVR
jgi:assimilatory nitrate reductase catalytic subunit